MKKYIVLAVLILFVSGMAFASTAVEKVDDYSAKFTVSNVQEKDGVKTTITSEKVFTLEELTQAKAQSETALKSWQDEKKKAEDNIVVQTAQIKLWDDAITEFKAKGIVEKPKEEVKPIAEQE